LDAGDGDHFHFTTPQDDIPRTERPEQRAEAEAAVSAEKETIPTLGEDVPQAESVEDTEREEVAEDATSGTAYADALKRPMTFN
jgi:hypothetical protein